MAIIRVHKNKNYTVMSNYHFKEKNMSLKAKGLLSQMLSLPDDWDYSIAGLVAINKENETSIKSTLDELKEFKYLTVTKLLPNETKSGRLEYVYDIYEKPYEKQDIEKQDVEKQGVEFLGVEFLGVENQGQLNTNKLNIEKQNNDDIKKERKNKTSCDEIINSKIDNQEIKVADDSNNSQNQQLSKPTSGKEEINALKEYINCLKKEIEMLKNKERKKDTSYDEIINSKIDNQEIKDLLYEFIKMRTLKKKPLTDRALTIQINKLFKLSSDLVEQREIIENSIVKCWDEFYPLKKEANNENNRSCNKRDGSEYSMYD